MNTTVKAIPETARQRTTPQIRARMRQFWLAGHSLRQIAVAFGYSEGAVQAIKRRERWSADKSAEVERPDPIGIDGRQRTIAERQDALLRLCDQRLDALGAVITRLPQNPARITEEIKNLTHVIQLVSGEATERVESAIREERDPARLLEMFSEELSGIDFEGMELPPELATVISSSGCSPINQSPPSALPPESTTPSPKPPKPSEITRTPPVPSPMVSGGTRTDVEETDLVKSEEEDAGLVLVELDGGNGDSRPRGRRRPDVSGGQ